jgi:hypothetical protein
VVAQVTPDSFVYSWSLPTQGYSFVDSVTFRDTNYNAIKTFAGPFYPGETVSIAWPVKINPYLWSAAINGVDKVWNSGYLDSNNPTTSCVVNGSLSVNQNGVPLQTVVNSYTTESGYTCRTSLL